MSAGGSSRVGSGGRAEGLSVCGTSPAGVGGRRIVRASSSRGRGVEYLYDGDCSVRRQERKTLEMLDRESKITFVNIAETEYDQNDHRDISYEEAMREPVAIGEDGEITRGVRVYGTLYRAIGLGFVWRLAELPLVSTVVEKVFDYWSDNRLRITGRPPLEQILAERDPRDEA